MSRHPCQQIDEHAPATSTPVGGGRGYLRLFRFLRRQWYWMALAPLAMGVEAGMDLMQPLLMSGIVDDGIVEGSQAAIRAAGWKMLFCAVLGALGGMACTFVSGKAATGFGNDMRKAVFGRVLNLSFAQTDKFTTGSLVTRLTEDVMVMQFVVVMLSRMLLRSPFLLVGSVVLVLRTDWRLSLPLLASAPLLSWIVFHWMRKMLPLFAARHSRTDVLSSGVQEALEGIRVVKAFAAENRELERFDKRNEFLAEAGREAGMLSTSLGPALQFVQQITLVAIVFWAAHEANASLVKVGEVAAIVNYATQVMMALVMLSFQSMHFSRAMICARRLSEVLGTEPEIRDGPHPKPPKSPLIEFRDVSFSYPGASGAPVLQDITFSVQPGEHLAIVGGTGSGKSTLLSLIPRFRDVSRGSVRVGGIDVRKFRLTSLRGCMGIVLQNPRLFSGTIADNVRWGATSATDEQVREAARVAQAERFVDSFPDGWKTQVAQGGASLSGGQRQRLALARAIVGKPDILLLDDATSAIDTVTERSLRSALRERLRGTTVLQVAQRVESVRDADRILVLSLGRVAGIGTHSELLENCPEYRQIVDSQALAAADTVLSESGKEDI